MCVCVCFFVCFIFVWGVGVVVVVLGVLLGFVFVVCFVRCCGGKGSVCLGEGRGDLFVFLGFDVDLFWFGFVAC